MIQKIIKKQCPTCMTLIGVGFFSHREEIVRCPKCKEILIDNPKRKQIGVVLTLSGFLIWIGFHYWIGMSLSLGGLIILFSIIISYMIRNWTKLKKDLVIRNKQTDEISYIDRLEWNEILENSSGKDNIFEIIEEIK